MKSAYCALVLGVCSHGLAICRSLKRHGIQVHVLEPDSDLPGFRTSSAHVHTANSINDSRLIEQLFAFRKTIHSDTQIVVFPTNDNNVRVIAQHAEQLAESFIVSWLSSAQAVENLLYKSEIEARCREKDMLYPASSIAKTIVWTSCWLST